MNNDVHFSRPEDGHRLRHDPFKANFATRLIGWTSSCSREGLVNLVSCSVFAVNPQIVGLSSEVYKDSIRNIEETRELV